MSYYSKGRFDFGPSVRATQGLLECFLPRPRKQPPSPSHVHTHTHSHTHTDTHMYSALREFDHEAVLGWTNWAKSEATAEVTSISARPKGIGVGAGEVVWGRGKRGFDWARVAFTTTTMPRRKHREHTHTAVHVVVRQGQTSLPGCDELWPECGGLAMPAHHLFIYLFIYCRLLNW